MELVTISVDPRFGQLESRFRVSRGLIYEPGRSHGKERSTDLYVSSDWQPQSEEIAIKETINRDPEHQVTIFRVPDDLVKMLTEVTNNAQELIGGKTFEVAHSIRDRVDEFVKERFGLSTSYHSDSQMVILRSNPDQGIQTGQTTNGLHFDNEETFSIRMGINLGDVPRYVYYVPFERSALLPGKSSRESQSYYQELSLRELFSFSILIKPGEGWTLPTTEFLHDGRRAESLGASTLALFRLIG